MRILENFFDDIDDVNVQDETAGKESRFYCSVSSVENPKESYIRHCIENMSSVEIDSIIIKDSDNIVIDFDIKREEPYAFVNSVINFLIGLWQGMQRKIYSLCIGNYSEDRKYMLQSSIYQNILDMSVNRLTNNISHKKDYYRPACGSIAFICNVL